ncbi:MAG: HAD family phosphatase [Eubacteriaceae bacterium]|nr:HAD family phosphatase [Eubacteriaceae bacterium]
MKIKGAIFDFDGTLLDSMGIWLDLGERYLKWKGLTPASNLYEHLKSLSLLEAAQYFQKEYGLLISEKTIIGEINTLMENDYRNTLLLKDSAEGFLRKLKNAKVKMVIATAIERPLVEAALNRLKIADYFCGIITCSEAGFGKDSPKIFSKALELLDTSKNETVVFEDALHAIQTAKSVGFLVAAVYDKSAEIDEEEIKSAADWYLNSFDEWEMNEG